MTKTGGLRRSRDDDPGDPSSEGKEEPPMLEPLHALAISV
jgi:hypothetical protein